MGWGRKHVNFPKKGEGVKGRMLEKGKKKRRENGRAGSRVL